MARHGGLGAHGPHGRGKRFRSRRAGLLHHLERRAARGRRSARTSPVLKDARNIDELKAMDTIVSCQGGDYTNEVYPKLRAAGWNGYWIDAASTLRMEKDAIIILDPVNLNVIRERPGQGHQELHRRQLHGLAHAHGPGRALRARARGVDDAP